MKSNALALVSSSSESWTSAWHGVVSEDSENDDEDDEEEEEHASWDRRRRSRRSKLHHHPDVSSSIARGGVACPFPWKLHDMLEDLCSGGGNNEIVTWNTDGTAFCVLNTKVFVQSILPRFFAQTKYASFQRQLNLYGFTRFSMALEGSSSSKSFYAHPHFLRGHRDRVRCMIRCKIKGTGKKRFASPLAHFHQDEEEEYHEEHSLVEESFDPSDDTFWNASTADEVSSLDLPLWSDARIEDGELAFFEGSPFHFLDAPVPLDLDRVWTTTTTTESVPKILNWEQQQMILVDPTVPRHPRSEDARNVWYSSSSCKRSRRAIV